MEFKPFFNFFLMIAFLAIIGCRTNAQKKPFNVSIYDIEINDAYGKPLHLDKLKGKKILFVNVASECGFTKQYKELQELYSKYKEQLYVVGLPCNQFGGQEPGTITEILSFCKQNYDVEFIVTEKIEVKGENQHPLYKWLTQKSINGVKDSSVKWNFQKYLVDEEGYFIDYWFSVTSPMSSKIINYLK